MFQVSSTIQSLRTLSDGTWRLTVDCQEMSPEEELELLKLKKQIGWFLFKINPLKEEDIPEEPSPEFKTDKSPSQRLRAILYKYWQLNTSQSKTFNEFYNSWVEKKIGEVKTLLP